MDWTDEGIVVGLRPYGETSAVLTVLTRQYGRHAGLVRGARGPRARALFEVGNQLAVSWRARLAEHLGHFRCELVDAPAARLLQDPLRLAALSAATAVVESALPEREPHARVYESLHAFLQTLGTEGEDWRAAYVRWEVALLADLGFGLDLTRCALTGTTEDLAFVSPASGRAVASRVAAPYLDSLIPLPPFLRDQRSSTQPVSPAAMVAGLRLTGYFLDRYAFAVRPDRTGAPGRAPAARDRFVDRVVRCHEAIATPDRETRATRPI
jgi:DNA repair protein RecO (recombination protein O)